MKTRLVAEICSNWRTIDRRGGLDRAIELIRAAGKFGASDVKFQLLRGDRLTRDVHTQLNLKDMELPVDWIPLLKKEADSAGVGFLCTPFFLDAVDILDDYVNEWKIASWDITYLPLLEKVGENGKPVILSTGASTEDEIKTALSLLRPGKEIDAINDVTLLHCTGGYPTEPKYMNLRRILDLGTTFWPLKTGLSSHCINPIVVAGSVLYMADVIEVHFDLDDRRGVESGHSFCGQELSTLVKYIEVMESTVDCKCNPQGDELARRIYRRDESDWLRPVL